MRILCLDGGGIRGIFSAAILQEIEQECGKPVNEMFDMIAGTSTGSIIAASVVLNKGLNEVKEKYKTHGKVIFTPQAKIGLFKTVYNDKEMRKYFREQFGEVSLSEIKKPLLIPSVNISEGSPYVYRSNYRKDVQEDLSVKVWDAVLSSCSAPVYFPPNNVQNKYLTADGGLWANNPSLVCLTEAVHYFKEPMDQVRILSIGTGEQKINFEINSKKSWGIKEWLPFHLQSRRITPKLLDLAMHLSSEAVSEQCEKLMGKNYLRLNADLGKEVPFDEMESIEELVELSKQVIKNKKREVLEFLR
ncbi:CBASS cGAMP-activated phospholipase [Evansella clarkii]|uniref:CBASS cGAMP-activated phospholipase n=1 Tax=Evansella clarkii TaxID=79879 RepID=UPI000B437FFB|nr:CBASS cGAMP-activated phospholipase [Evansella clarkii]